MRRTMIMLTMLALLLLTTTALASESFETVDGWSGYITEGGAVVLTGYHGTSKTPLVPNSVDGHLLSYWDVPSGDGSLRCYVTSMGSNAAKVLSRCGWRFSLVDYPDVEMNYQENDTEIWAYPYDRELSSYTIPEGVTDVCFEYCVNLEEVTFPSTVTKIRDFSNCSSLESIIIPEGVTWINGGAFSRCKELTSVKLPKSLKYIGRGLFYGCDQLLSIDLPDNIETMYDNPFINWSGMVYAKIGTTTAQTIVDSDSGRFYDSHYPELCFLGINKEEKQVVAAEGIGYDIVEVNLPKGVEIVSSGFSGRSMLTRVTIPEGITEIPNSAFSNCSSLTSISIPSTVTSIGSYAFYQCSSLTNITIPGSVTNFGRNAFYGCPSLYVTISSESPIRYYLEDNDIPYTIANVPALKLPDTLTFIEAEAFANTNVQAVYLPDACTQIGAYAFKNCSRLIAVHFPNDNIEIDDNAFSDTGAQFHFFVTSTSGNVAAYAREHGIEYFAG